MSCQGFTKSGEKCKIKVKGEKEFCWRHDKDHIPDKKRTSTKKKELEAKIRELTEEVKHLTSMIEGMKLMRL